MTNDRESIGMRNVLEAGRAGLVASSHPSASQILSLDDLSLPRRATPFYVLQAVQMIEDLPLDIRDTTADALLAALARSDWSATTAFAALQPVGRRKPVLVMIGISESMIALPQEGLTVKQWVQPQRREVLPRFAMAILSRFQEAILR